MSHKNFVIIGGSKGIGHAIVQRLTQQNHRVIVISRTLDQLESNPLIEYIQKDIIKDELSPSELPDVIDGLIYCPGSIVLKPFKSLSEEQFSEDFAINCLGAVKSIKASLNGLKKSESHPSIVLFSTVAVSQGMPFHASIAAAKGAVEGLTKSLAAEFAPTIRVNCIAPSLTDTPLAAKILSSPEKIQAAEQRHPLKSIGNADDLAGMAVFLLSQDAKWISGQILHVDGGMSTLRS
ncbi:MAG TPA: SDR family oxidoreductase [Saprospiraceae bacterium]|nr:SDR family oxidoreductase [Saprospiraceae bacterium]